MSTRPATGGSTGGAGRGAGDADLHSSRTTAEAHADAGASFIAQLAGAGAEQLAPEPARGRFGGFAMLGIVILVAGGVLGVMRWLGMGTHLQLATVKIDYALDESASAIADHSRVLGDLRDSEKLVQVPLDKIQMNPFLWNALGLTAPQAKAEADPAASQAELSRRAAEARRQEIQRALAALKLNSVMGGSAPIARVSGTLVRPGDRVGELFTVKSIGGRSVELTADGETYTLTIGE